MAKLKKNQRLWHNPDEPIPAEIEARMTKPKVLEELCQVWVEAKGRGIIPVGPKVNRAVAEEFCAAIKMQIINGREKFWTNPHLYVT